jgi:hypothetical protein
MGRGKDFGKPANRDVCIKVLAGRPQQWTEVGTIAQMSDLNAVNRVDLTSVAKGHKEICAKVEMHAPKLDASVLNCCAIYQVRFVRPWSKSVRAGLPEQEPSLELARKRNLVVSWRRDAELAIEENRDGAAKAHALYEHGDYAKAYNEATK